MKRILVIDDNPLNTKVYIEPLDKKYQVDIVMSLVAVKRKLQINSYDLCVVDIMMPTQKLGGENEIITGLYFYSNSLQKEYPNIPVLFWSNLTSDTFEEYFQENPPQNVCFIQKTKENYKHLLEKVDQLLK